MPRAIWNGSISFGLVTIPVSLYAAVESREELSFHLLHKKDGSRIENKRFCKEEGIEVPWGELVKGYEYAKGEYVVMTEEDFDKARVPATQTFDIRAFVPATEVEDLYFDQPYYLAPGGPAGVKAYALLRDALRDTSKLGVGTIVLRQREHLGALEPVGEALVLTTMRFAHEIRPATELDLPKAREGFTAKEMKLAHQLIDTLSSKWDPSEYKDTYTEVLRHAIQQKIEGKEISIPQPERPRTVVNLMEALEASLKASPRKEPVKAAGRAKAASSRKRGARRIA